MDWKYQRFERETTIDADRDTVPQAVRATIADSLPGWQVTDTTDGLQAIGSLAGHGATVTFRIEPGPSGTTVAVTLAVERTGAFGFMLVDIGGYYDGQLRHWLQHIQWHIAQKLAPTTELPSPKPAKPADNAATRRAASCATGCFIAFILCPLPVYFLCALIGLFTGELYIGSGTGGTPTTIHGTAARIASAVVLLGYAALTVWLVRQKKAGWPALSRK